MAEVVRDSTICVGREYELTNLHQHHDQSLKGKSGLCIIKGGSGVGKSTLLREFVSRVETAEPDLVIAWGHCDQNVGGLRPLLPWTEILESFTGVAEFEIAQEQLKDKRGIVKSAKSAFMELAPDLVELLLPGIGLVIRFPPH